MKHSTAEVEKERHDENVESKSVMEKKREIKGGRRMEATKEGWRKIMMSKKSGLSIRRKKMRKK